VSTVGLIVAGVALVREVEKETVEPIHPPITSPTPSKQSKPRESTPPDSVDSMTPEEVVRDPHAELLAAAMLPGDPETKISIWRASCSWCPDRPDGRGGSLGPPTFTGMAVTTDGYKTATYVRHPFSFLGAKILSPTDDQFLFVDDGNGREWLIGLDGDVRRVERVTGKLRPIDPRLWFECGRAGGATTTWCSLNPETATAYVWPEEWNRSAVSPLNGEQPWGWSPTGPSSYEDPGAEVDAWWYDENGALRHRILATDAMGGVVRGSPAGDLGYWVWRLGTDTVELHTGHERGASWEVETRRAPGFNRWVQMTRAPDGALLAWTYYPGLVVWRAEASGGSFRRVLHASGPDLGGTVLTQDGLVYANGSGVGAVSNDGGQTWTTNDAWR
jgi:hypothetical protein